MKAVRLIPVSLGLLLALPLFACSSSDEPDPEPGASAGSGGTGGSAGAGASGGGSGGSAGSSSNGGAAGDTQQPTCTKVTQACDPFGRTAAAACAATHQCHALESGETECSCLSAFAGPQNAPCSDPSECQAGLICESGTCRTLCDPSAAQSGCEGGLPCKALGSSTQYGYCDS